MKNYKELVVWRKAHEMTLDVYQVTRTFPKEELYGLTSQLRRSAASIGANIAEGSASETEYHLLLANDLKLLHAEDYRSLSRRAE